MRRLLLSMSIALAVLALVGCGLLERAVSPLRSSGRATPSRSAQVETGQTATAVVEPAQTAVAVEVTEESRPAPLSTHVLEGLSLLDDALANVYDRVGPSVVNIAVVSQQGVGSGSGWVWDTQGHIVTNNHVVQGAEKVTVRFANEIEVDATVVGTDPGSDLAVIRVDVAADVLVPVELGDSSEVRVGQLAIAIGNPFGFERTMTLGIVSAMGRVNRQSSGFSQPDLIQVDTPINPGNSGGPLLDIYGRVIGVNTMIFSRTGEFSGIGFAVPVNAVKRVVPSLIETGGYAHPYLGITGMDITPATASLLGLPVEQGALVESVVKGGPSDQAGIRGGSDSKQVEGFARAVMLGGDIIIAMAGRPIRGMDDLITRLETFAVGDSLVLTVLRGGEQLDITVTLGERPPSAQEPVFGFSGP